MSIFEKRVAYKPFEYPEVLKFIELINKSYWVHSEVDFTADLQDFKTKLSDQEREIVKRCLLMIAQIEVSVKSFWGDLYKHFPKPEFNGLGASFAESEFRHSEAYSRLLTVLGYEDDFTEFVNTPLIQERTKLFDKYLSQSEIRDKLLYFVVIVENVSLFTQFATILSFARFRGEMKNIANIVAWTSIDEQIHAQTGIWLLNQIRKENPELTTLDRTFSTGIEEIINNEDKIVDFIFKQAELPFFTAQNLKDFMRHRIDISMKSLNLPIIFNITTDQYKPMRWFDEETQTGSLDDFFAKRPVDYTKHDKSITGNDLF